MKKSSAIVLGLGGIVALFALMFAFALTPNVRFSPTKLEKDKLCINQCKLGEKYCEDRISFVCGYYNSSCLNWGSGVPCTYGCWKDQCLPYSCFDSDSGVNIYTAGNVTEGTVLAGQILSDYCYSSNQVTEHSCKIAYNESWSPDLGWAKKEIYNCPGGYVCRGRVCVSNQTHLACVSNTCTSVSGAGNSTCSPAGSFCGNAST